MQDEDARRFSPATARNRGPIFDAFLPFLPAAGRILELGSGAGEHIVFLSAELPGATFLPSDPDETARASIAAWTAYRRARNVEAPLPVDVTAPGWERAVGAVDAVFSINMAHIAPASAIAGLFDGAARLLGSGAPLLLYGPFRRHGAHTAPSNEAFDADIRARDPRSGLRDFESEIAPAAARAGFAFAEEKAMPANNFVFAFRRL